MNRDQSRRRPMSEILDPLHTTAPAGEAVPLTEGQQEEVGGGMSPGPNFLPEQGEVAVGIGKEKRICMCIGKVREDP